MSVVNPEVLVVVVFNSIVAIVCFSFVPILMGLRRILVGTTQSFQEWRAGVETAFHPLPKQLLTLRSLLIQSKASLTQRQKQLSLLRTLWWILRWLQRRGPV